MKKIKLGLLMGAMVLGLCACGKEEDDDKDDVKIPTTTQVTTEASTVQNKPEATTEAKPGQTTEEKTEATTEAPQESTNELHSEVTPGNDASTGDEDMDVVKLVNLRGDYATVYLLADGRYMDRVEMVYIYDGNETWTDENGVEWNRALDTPNE